MSIFKKLLGRMGVMLALLWVFVATGNLTKAQTNDTFVRSVILDEDQHVELNPGDPIRYTVTYGRNQATPGPHSRQNWTISILLSTDGNPGNENNYRLDFFNGSFPDQTSEEVVLQRTFITRIPPNFTGTYFLVAKIHERGTTPPSIAAFPENEPADTRANNWPSVNITATARVTIRPVDSPLVSRVSTNVAGGDANELSESPSITANGRYVVFHSEATNIVGAPTAQPGVSQIYLRDTITNEIRMISQLGGQPGNAESKYPVISSLGYKNNPLDASEPIKYYVAYQSSASNLISGVGSNDTNQHTDIFLYELSTGVTTRISVPSGAPFGAQANDGSSLPSISGDGSLISFESRASNLLGANGDTNGRSDIYVYNRHSKVIVAASASATGVLGNGESTQGRISEDGSTVVFRSYAGNIAAGRTGVLAVSEIVAKSLPFPLLSYNDATQRMELVTELNSLGKAVQISVIREVRADGSQRVRALNFDAFDPAVSANGRFVAFASRATNTVAPNGIPNRTRSPGSPNTAGVSQVYVVNRAVNLDESISGPHTLRFDQTSNTSLNVVSVRPWPQVTQPVFDENDVFVGFRSTLVSEYGFGSDESLAPTISGNGRYIGFRSEAGDLQTHYETNSAGRSFQTKASGVISARPNNEGVVIDTPTVTIIDSTDAGSGAEAYAVVLNGSVVEIVVTNQGIGYSTTANTVNVVIEGGGGSGAAATAVVGTAGVQLGRVLRVNVTAGGSGFATATGEFVQNSGLAEGAVVSSVLDSSGGLKDVNVLETGFGYFPDRTEIFIAESPTGDPFDTAIAVPVIENGKLYDVVVVYEGYGYTEAPDVFIAVDPLLPAEVAVYMSRGNFDRIEVVDPGSGYISEPILQISVEDVNGVTLYPRDDAIFDPEFQHDISFLSGLAANAVIGYADFNNTSDVYIKDTGIKAILVTNGGSGFGEVGSLVIDSSRILGGGGSGASARAIIEFGVISRIDLINSGAGYLGAPQIDLVGLGSGSGASAVAILVEGADRLSVSHFGEETGGLVGGVEVPSSRNLAMSSDGRYMLFASDASNTNGLIFGKSNQIPLDANGKRDVFIVDRRSGAAVSPVLGTAPTVALTVQTRPLSFESTRVISATGFDGGDVSSSGAPMNGVVRSIEIYANNVLIGQGTGTDSRLTVTTTWTAPRVAGPAQIYAVVTDGNGNRVLSDLTFIPVEAPTSQRPAITLSANQSSIALGQSVLLQAIVSDPEAAIAAVLFYANGLLINTDIAAPFEFVFTPTTSADFLLTAIVIDGAAPTVVEGGGITFGGVRNDALSNELILRVLPPPNPTVNISSPVPASAGASVAANVNQPVFFEFTASTANPNASIATVQLLAGGTLLPGLAERVGVTNTYRYTWIPTVAGAVSLTARATDSQGGVGNSAALPFQVSGVVVGLPNVSIDSPIENATLLTSQVATFVISATDTGGSVVKVTLFGNGVSQGDAVRNASTGKWQIPVNVSTLPTGLYAFVAVGVDNEGNIGSSAARNVVVASAPPTASIVTPGLPSGSSFVSARRGQPVPILVEAQPGDSLSAITNVDLNIAGASIGTAIRVGTTNQYSLIWTPTATGLFNLIATASDSKGGSTQSVPRSVFVQEPVGSAPVVTILAPAQTAATDGAVTPIVISNNSTTLFTARAIDADGSVASVAFYVDGKLLTTLTNQTPVGSNLYTTTLNTGGSAPLVPGLHTLLAIATDNAGNQAGSATVVLNVVSSIAAPPSVTLLSPQPNSLFIGGSTSLGVNVLASNFTSITQVQYFSNGVLIGTALVAPFSLDYTPPATGTYVIQAVAVDSAGGRTVSGVQSVQVSNPPPPITSPTITLADPFPNPVFIGQSTVLAATVAPQGATTITQVQFFVNNSSVAVVTSAPYTFTYLPPEVGIYTVRAVVTNSLGGTTSSQTRELVVNQLPIANDIYPRILQRTATSAEFTAAANLSPGALSAVLLQSEEYRDGNGELMFLNLAIFGRYPNLAELANLRTLRATFATDLDFINGLLASSAYTQEFGPISDLVPTWPTQFSLVRAFALRTYRHLYRVEATGTTANLVAQRFFNQISAEAPNLGLSPGQALLNYINDIPFGGAKTGEALDRVRVAGAILLLGELRPTNALIDGWAGFSLTQIANYYLSGGTGPVASQVALQSWREANFNSPANSGKGADTADFDNDGIPNLAEYAFGISPTAPSADPVRLGVTADGRFLTLTFNRVLNPALTYVIEAANSLTGGFSPTGVTFTGSAAGTVTYTDTVDLKTSGTPRFLRVVVSY